tara:strand:- start:16032 stop:16208 length:177 start_codon:yes stop_codon:yes gene_type:complete
MMTRRDFEALAEVLHRFSDDYPDQRCEAEWLAEQLAEVLANANPRFDEVRWRTACGVG